MEICCPKCGQLGKAADKNSGKRIRCEQCGLVFLAELKQPEPLENASDDKPPTSVPSRGAINCPYCEYTVVEEAKLLGQMIACPKCHANFKAPDCEADKKRAAATAVRLGYVFGTAMLAGGVVALLTGQSGILTCIMFALGVGVVTRILYQPLKRVPVTPIVIGGSVLLAWVLLDGALGYHSSKKSEPVPLHKLKEDLNAVTAWVKRLRATKYEATDPHAIAYRKEHHMKAVTWSDQDEHDLAEWEAEQQSLRNELTDRGQ
jgi:transcription initiation factor TFIIIB Brf1 subunit/transcription initiation factor TFIIB